MEFTNEANKLLYLHWVSERESIRIKKEAGEPRENWTKDIILSQKSFCNVRREDDRTTRWIKEHIRDKYRDHPNFIAILTMSRLVNLPDTLAELTDLYVSPDSVDWDGMSELVDIWREEKRTYTSLAFMVPAPGCLEGENKLATQIRNIYKPMSDNNTQIIDDLGKYEKDQEKIMEVLGQYKGMGKAFLNNQVLIDLAHTTVFPSDHYRLNGTYLGPGSKRGLTFLSGDAKGWDIKMRYLQSMVKDHTGMEISMHDIQNTLCEFGKYYQFVNNIKRKSRNYKVKE